jgi:hypothetical protein
MKIESILKRDPSTEVTLGDTTYRFSPDSTGAHVCEVEDQEHAAHLLSIKEGFKLPGDKAIPKALQKKVEKDLQLNQPSLAPSADGLVPVGSTVHPAVVDLGNSVLTDIAEVVDRALSDSGMTTQEWNELAPEARHDLIDGALDTMSEEAGNEVKRIASAVNSDLDTPVANDVNPNKGATAKTEPPKPSAAQKKQTKAADEQAEKDARASAAADYEGFMGKKPHGKWDADKILSVLKDAKADKAKQDALEAGQPDPEAGAKQEGEEGSEGAE